MAEQNVNMVILGSIPMDKNLKRYFLKKFKNMVSNNGQAFACEKMKHLRETLLGYRADANRSHHAEAWLSRSGFKVNGWLRKLFSYMDTQPENALQFVKLYCGPNDPIVSVDASAVSQHRVLEEARQVDSTTPLFLEKWLHHIGREKKLDAIWYGMMKVHPDEYCPQWMRKFIANHTYTEYCDYVRKWKSILWVEPIADDDEELQSRIGHLTPCAEMYVDYGTGKAAAMRETSVSFTDDLRNLVAMQAYLDLEPEWGGNGLTSANYSFVLKLMSPEALSMFMEADETPLPGANFMDGTYVGQIHHIPKKGTVKRRPIGPPNRFIQLGFVPVDLQLEKMLRKLSRARDCTFAQTRLNTYIGNRVNNDNLYVGSVDLHQATDFLPFNWMKTIWSELFEGRVSEMVSSSWNLFCNASSGAWCNEGYRDHWTTGQPLGALPSFKCLGISHNLLVEALAFTNGYGHSPYAILGDDIIICNKNLRKKYIQLMNNAGVPLSLNKSYEGRLVEFAGQFFIKGCAPFYNTDQRAITWNSLFDYQWATGIHIPYGQLPKKLRKKIARLAKLNGSSRDMLIYELAYYYGTVARGSHVPRTGKSVTDDLVAQLAIELSEADDHDPERDPWSGITFLSDGHPVCFGKRDYAEKNGFFLRYRKLEPKWFRDKYRPVATDKVIAVAARIIADNGDAATKTCPA